MTTDEAYKFAEVIDQQITRKLIQEPLNQRSVNQWALIARTIRTTTDLLDQECLRLRVESEEAKKA